MKKVFYSFLIFFSISIESYTQTPGAIDTTFNTSDFGLSSDDGTSNLVRAIAIQNDEKILISGDFSTYNGTARNSIARLNSDGSLDRSFNTNSGANGNIGSIAIQNDGKIVIGGWFTSYNGTAINRIARLNEDGSLDQTFNPGLGVQFSLIGGAASWVETITLQSDGKIIIGGNFSSYNGITIKGIARLNADGSLDSTFNPGNGTDQWVESIVIQNDGKIILGGQFRFYDGNSARHLVRINADGSIDPTFIYGTGASSDIYSIDIQSDGKIIIGGAFTSYNGIARNRVARINVDGSLDVTFNPNMGANNDVYTVNVQKDGKIILGGKFDSFNGNALHSIVRLNSNGSLDETFEPNTHPTLDILACAIQNDGKIIIGGEFISYNATSRERIARLHINGTLDNSFNIVTGLNGNVITSVLQSDGKIIIAGDFQSFNGTERNRIARLNGDGTIDLSFDPGTGANRSVLISALQSDEKIIIAGNFTSYNGVSRNGLARINSDGSLDLNFNPNDGANDEIRSISIQSDGKIIIVGDFTYFGVTAINRIARLNVDGNIDLTFNPGTGTNDIIFTSVIQSDGKIIIGGFFTGYNGTSRNRIARLNVDGSIDLTFNPGTGANSAIFTSAIQNDGKIIIGGAFTSYNGTARSRFARLNSNGTIDGSFNAGSGPNTSGESCAIQSDGKILIWGIFTSFNGTSRNSITRINTDGSLDLTFNPGSGANSNIFTIAIQNDGNIIIGGWFTSYNGTSRNRIARINANGSLDGTFAIGMGANDSVYECIIQPDGKIIVIGDFTSYNGWPRNYIFRLNIDGSLDTSFNPGSGTDNRIVTAALQSDGKIIIGGIFTMYNGAPRNRIARINNDGSLDLTFTPGNGPNNGIRKLVLQNDGKIIIGGDFTSYSGTTINRIARLNTNGLLDVSFNPGTGANNALVIIFIQNNGKIIIGGGFTSYNGIARNRIARLNANGTLDGTFDPGLGLNNTVQTGFMQSDGKIIIAGDFTTFNGVTRNRVARINTNGTIDVTFNEGMGANNTVTGSVLQSDGKIIICGNFTSYNGVPRKRIARLNTDGSLNEDFDPGTGANDWIYRMSIQSDGKIIIHGDFTSYNEKGRNRITRLFGDGCSISLSSVPNSDNQNVCANTEIVNITYIASGASEAVFTGLPQGISGNFVSNLITISGSPTESGIFNYTVTLVGTCNEIVTGTLVIIANPTVIIMGVNEICEGSSTIFTAAGGTTYLWSTGETTASINVITQGTYAVTVTSEKGCISTASRNLTLNPKPLASINGPNKICENTSTEWIATGGISYTWNNGASTQSIQINTGGTYTVTVTNASGCTNSISKTLILNNNPIAIITGIDKICEGSSAIFTAAGGATYLWSTGETTTTINVYTQDTYAVTITSDEGCFSAGTKTLTVNSNPLASINGPNEICEGSSTEWAATGGISYAWNNGEVTQAINLYGSGTYTVTVTNINGCTSSVTKSLSLNTSPTATISGPNEICEGSSGTFIASSGVTYIWSSGETTQTIIVTSEGEYKVTITDNNGCSAISNEITVLVNPKLIPSLSISLSTNGICAGDNVTFTAIPVNGGVLPSFQWYVDGALQSEIGPLFSTSSLTNNEQIFCRLTSNAECRSHPTAQSNIISIVVNPLLTPEVSISTPATSVLECQDVTFTPTSINGGISPTYQWFVNGNPKSSTPTFSTSDLINGDQVSCIMTSSATCKSTPKATSNTLTISISPLPQPIISISGDTISSANYKDAQYLYSWYFNENEVSKSPYIICNQFGSGSYYLVINYNGCTDTSNTTDIVCTVPTNDIGNSIYFMVYPNPTNSLLNISGRNLESGEIRIFAYNLLGQKLEERIISISDNYLDINLDISNFASGVYNFAVHSGNRRQVFKIFKID